MSNRGRYEPVAFVSGSLEGRVMRTRHDVSD